MTTKIELTHEEFEELKHHFGRSTRHTGYNYTTLDQMKSVIGLSEKIESLSVDNECKYVITKEWV